MKILKWVGIVLLTLIVLGFLGFNFVLKPMTKKASPEDTIAYVKGDLNIDVFYCQPSKKGRDIFGGLVPYGQVWRTGANEATTFETNKDLLVGGKELPAGKYTIFTIPNENEWEVIFNNKMYSWGVAGFNGESPRKPEYDEAIVKVPVNRLGDVVEMFTMKIEDGENPELTMSWDQTQVNVPIQVK